MSLRTLLQRNNRTIKLFWFRYKYPEIGNFGDELSCKVVEYLSGKKVEWADLDECELVAMGSILGPALSRHARNHIAIWGTGLMFSNDKFDYDPSINNIHAVRGKLTAARLGIKDTTYGDPGLLVDQLYKPSKNIKKIGIVPHYVDQDNPLVKGIDKSKEVKIINVRQEVENVVSEIASCKLVISSSLHGLITAHAFGIPAYWVELSDKVAGSGFKFDDYYSVFGSKPRAVSKSVLTQIEKEADNLISLYAPPNDLENIKRELIKSFPSGL